MAEQMHTFTEAPASATVKVNLNGYDVLFTLRDESGKALLEKMAAALKALETMGATPAARSNGHRAGNGDADPETRTCELHGVVMQRREKNGQVWYSHRLGTDAEGKPVYCRGQAK